MIRDDPPSKRVQTRDLEPQKLEKGCFFPKYYVSILKVLRDRGGLTSIIEKWAGQPFAIAVLQCDCGEGTGLNPRYCGPIPCSQEVMGSSRGNNLLQKCEEIEELKTVISECQDDKDMQQMASEELSEATEGEIKFQLLLLKSLLPKDDADERDCILEVRAGWKYEVLEVAESDLKGYKNRAKALKILCAKLYEIERLSNQSSRSKLRMDQIGSGDRFERIHTYNFPQGRVTDHRVGITTHSIDDVLQGEDLDAFIDALLLQEEMDAIASSFQQYRCCISTEATPPAERYEIFAKGEVQDSKPIFCLRHSRMEYFQLNSVQH
ncbi:hypothetical protein RND71_038385 [Anisodus tanguticus]|uniref:Peptide chain release factor domain-containing protein n=1 Tax=Anisodus tanguticus TaxID=243964 RepID=A0AAE1QYY3_9SOLA|nr:hypothetical protein RND71_038385 [Anisodus tanguticus]